MDEMLMNANTMTEPVTTNAVETPNVPVVQTAEPVMMESSAPTTVAPAAQPTAKPKMGIGTGIAIGIGAGVAGGLLNHYVVEPWLNNLKTKRRQKKLIREKVKQEYMAQAEAASNKVNQTEEKTE